MEEKANHKELSNREKHEISTIKTHADKFIEYCKANKLSLFQLTQIVETVRERCEKSPIN